MIEGEIYYNCARYSYLKIIEINGFNEKKIVNRMANMFIDLEFEPAAKASSEQQPG